MAELYLVRHGQASFGAANYDKLSELGHQQAVWLGEYFKHRGQVFDSILTGDLVRHRETAEGIAQGMGLEQPIFNPFSGLDEFDFHSLLHAYTEQFPQEQLTADSPRADYYKLLKKTMHLWSENGLEGDLPESWAQFEDRVQGVMTMIQKEMHGQKVLAVSSGGAIAMALRQVLKSPSETVIELNLQTKNTAIAHCFFNPKAIRVTSFNHVPHLDTNERHENITYS